MTSVTKRIRQRQWGTLLVLAMLIIGATSTQTAVATPNITATKTDSLVVDNDNDTQADPGDTIGYTIVLHNSGTADALDATFNDTLDPNTTFVPGSLRVTPMAVDDSYSVIGNTHITHNTAGGLLANDIDPDDTGGNPPHNENLTVTAFSGATAQGGAINLSSDGSFTYAPPRGFEGTDTHTYTVLDSHGQTDSATITFNIAGSIWWIDNTAAGGGDGRSTSPYDSLSAFNAVNDNTGTNPSNGDIIFLHQGSGSYDNGLTLLTNQKLCGQGVSLSPCSGLTPPLGTAFPAATANPTLINTTANNGSHGIVLGSSNTVMGVNIGSKSNGAGISGANFGTLTLSSVSISGAGAALALNNGSLNNVVFDSLASTSTPAGMPGILLENITSGTLTSNSTTITNPGGIALRLNSNSATFNWNGLNITTTGQTGISATSGGSLNITGSANTVTTTNATAVHIATTTIGSSNATFRSISANGGSNGIILDGNTGGSFNVTGNGTAGSGGTIQNMTGANAATIGIGIYLNNTGNVFLNYLQLNNFDNFAVRGTSVSNITLDNTVINGVNGNSAADDEGSVAFNELTGAASISGSQISGGLEDNVRIVNTGGTLNRLTLSGTTIGLNDTTLGNDGITIIANNTAVVNVTVNGNSSFTGARGDLFQFLLNNAAGGDLIFTDNMVDNDHTNTASGGGGVTLNTGGSWIGSFTFNFDTNIFRDALGSAVLISKGSGSGSFVGRFNNNQIGVAAVANSGSAQASGLDLIHNGGGTFTVEVNNNQIRQYNSMGIFMTVGSGTGGSFNGTVTNNAISDPGTLPAINGIQLNGGTVAGDNHAICLALTGNTTAGSGPSGIDIRVRQRQATTVRLPGYAGANNDNTAVQNFVAANNPGSEIVSAANTVPTGGGFVGGAACALPPAPAPMSGPIGDSTHHSTSETAESPASNEETTAPTTNKPAINHKSASVKNELAALMGGGSVSLDPFTLPAGESIIIIFQVTIDDPLPGGVTEVCNQAAFSGSNFANVLTDDPDVAGSADPTCTPIDLIEADLSIAKTDGQATAVPGQSITYTIVATNNGPEPVTGAAVSDSFPSILSGTSWTCLASAGSGCTASGSGDINDMVALLVGGSVTYTINSTIDPAATGNLSNTATVTVPVGVLDTDTGNNSATDTDTLTPQADLAVSKNDNADPVVAGDNLIYTMTVTNNGPSDAQNVVATDTLPGSITFVSTAGCAEDPNGAPTCSLGDLAVGGVTQYTLTVTTTSAGVITNTVNVASSTADPNSANNSDSEGTTVEPPSPDLTLSKDDGGITAVPGGLITYTLTYHNIGGQNALNTILTETVPAYTSFNAAASTTGWNCIPDVNAGSVCSLNVGTVVAGGSSETAVFAVTVDSVIPAGVEVISNTAVIADDGSHGPDLNPTDNSAGDTTPVEAAPDLVINKDDSGVVVAPGGTVVYTLSYDNVGDQEATGITLSDVVPTYTTFNPAASTAGWSCVPDNNAGSTCTFVVTSLPVGGGSSVTFAVAVDNPVPGGVTEITNTAAIADDGTNGADPNPGDNSDDETTPVNQTPVCSGATPSAAVLWPPNHDFNPINVSGVTDPEGDPVAITITDIFQDEAVNAPGSGNTSPDGMGVGSDTAQVRAERVEGGNGRVYHIYFTAQDIHGNSCSGEVLVGVPNKRNQTAVDDGPLYDSTIIPLQAAVAPGKVRFSATRLSQTL